MDTPAKKLALCFMSYGDVEQTRAWRYFFASADPAKYTVYLHRADGVLDSWIPNAICIPTRKTAWGDYSLVEVELDLYAEALKDPNNQMCVLLSGDSVPIYTFNTIYAKLINCHGVVQLLHTKHPDRVFKVVFNGEELVWRKGSQWKALNRTISADILRHRRFLNENWANRIIPDEHAIPILLDGLAHLEQVSKYWNIMYCDFMTASKHCKLNHHKTPKTFHTTEVTRALIQLARREGALFLRKICKTSQIDPTLLFNTN